jgi:GMP reductase
MSNILTKYELIEINNISYVDSSQDTFDLEVEHDHSYTANGFAVHNSVCTTRTITGVGYPQLSGIIECADAAHGAGGLIIGDGGCTMPGDVVKAFAAGADFVMIGGMFAAHMEGEYELEDMNGKSCVKFYGMSSHEAVKKHGARKDGYRTTEGKVVLLPFKGSVISVVEDILGGIISACAYTGARRLKDLTKCATFIRVSKTHNTVYNQYDTGE